MEKEHTESNGFRYDAGMKIQELRNYQPKCQRFDDLDWPTRRRAEEYLARFLERWQGNLPNWRLAILVACARQCARLNYDSSWGRRMRATKAGKRSRLCAVMNNRDPLVIARGRRSLLCKLRRQKQGKLSPAEMSDKRYRRAVERMAQLNALAGI